VIDGLILPGSCASLAGKRGRTRSLSPGQVRVLLGSVKGRLDCQSNIDGGLRPYMRPGDVQRVSARRNAHGIERRWRPQQRSALVTPRRAGQKRGTKLPAWVGRADSRLGPAGDMASFAGLHGFCCAPQQHNKLPHGC
jgi:hypothetical protein